MRKAMNCHSFSVCLSVTAVLSVAACDNEPRSSSNAGAAEMLAALEACDVKIPKLLMDDAFGDRVSQCEADCTSSWTCEEWDALVCESLSRHVIEDYLACLERCEEHIECGGRIAQLCDGHFECGDGRDEERCPEGTHYTCGDGTEIASQYECDGLEDCPWGDDEHCEGPPKYHCDDGTKIDRARECDGEAQCPDGSDEWVCTSFELAPSYVCDDGTEIDKSYYCDDQFDCPDHSDELGCNPWGACGWNTTGCALPNGVVVDVGESLECTDIGNFVSGFATCMPDGSFDADSCS